MYKVYDNYDFDMEYLGESETRKGCDSIIKEREIETDYECWIVIVLDGEIVD